VRETTRERREQQIQVHGAEPGLYIQFEGLPGTELKLESLEDRGKGIELVAVQSQPAGDSTVQLATVFVPDGALSHFFRRLEQYATERTAKGEPRHKDLVDRIAALRRATLRALWTDTADVYPTEDESIWWEVWLRRHDGQELERLLDFAAQVNLQVRDHRLAFVDRIVTLVRGTVTQLSMSLSVLNDIAELRRAKESAAVFIDASPPEQTEWADELKERTTPPAHDAPAVCILDTGVTRAHPLLIDVIAQQDATSIDPTWGSHDNGGGPANMGHGTQMAGLAAYGDLTTPLSATNPITLRHRVESVKILPPGGVNPPDLYGALTAQAVARPEVIAPQRLRTFSLAITAADERDRGQPTSWSAAIDALAAGRTFDPTTQGLVYLAPPDAGSHRLFVVSTGNIPRDRLEIAHLDRSDVEPIHDPAQAWNALTVGAWTAKATISDPTLEGWSPVTTPGELSPWSTTSVSFQDPWPIKPDVVFEGGNAAYNGQDIDYPIADLSLLTTYYQPNQKLFVLSTATSAATAQVARLATMVRGEYPSLWPETVRALVVHSAEWTTSMRAHLDAAAGKRARARLVRRYGFGVPQFDRALRSAGDALTLVSQSTIRPFRDGKMREMLIHELPWPIDALEQLAQTTVRLRVTLSYFVEPNPGRRGWTRRHRYASHGLRFDIKAPTETIEAFRKRINQRALEDEEKKPSTDDDGGWLLGDQARNRGSIHSDIWQGTAADLAARGVVGIYPVSGWWKDQPQRDRSELGARYALVLSIETQAEHIDLWTPVAIQIGAPVAEVPVVV
jgi:hypothetical protein